MTIVRNGIQPADGKTKLFRVAEAIMKHDEKESYDDLGNKDYPRIASEDVALLKVNSRIYCIIYFFHQLCQIRVVA